RILVRPCSSNEVIVKVLLGFRGHFLLHDLLNNTTTVRLVEVLLIQENRQSSWIATRYNDKETLARIIYEPRYSFQVQTLVYRNMDFSEGPGLDILMTFLHSPDHTAQGVRRRRLQNTHPAQVWLGLAAQRTTLLLLVHCRANPLFLHSANRAYLQCVCPSLS
ncbi:hypothetical protein M513_00693, partial [Trichuris suis]